MAPHGPRLRIFVFRLERKEQGETASNGFWHIPHGPYRPQILFQQLPLRKLSVCQHTPQILFCLGGGEIRDGLPCGGSKDKRITAEERPGQ